MAKNSRNTSSRMTYKFFCRVCGNTVYLADPSNKAWCSNRHRMSEMKVEKQ